MGTLTIDGQQVEAEAGATILVAARKAGIFIPTLCDHPALRPSGGCRLCVVEVAGARGPQPACTLLAGEGMVVTTDTPALREGRQFVLNMLFSENSHLCPYCPVSGGDCELQNAAYHEGMTHWDNMPAWTPRPVDASSPYFVFDPNRCILCRRCVRACGDLAGQFTLGMADRGSQTRLVADADVPLGDSSCVACGTCLQVCPTGALYGKRDAYQGRAALTRTVASICVGCSVGCGLRVRVRDGQLVRLEGDWSSPVSGGLLCHLGRFDPLDEARQRVLAPLVRGDGALMPASWEEALDSAARGLHGAAGLISTRLPAEALGAFRQLMEEGLHSPLFTSIEEGRTAGGAALASEATLDDVRAADLVVLWGADIERSHQVAGFIVKRKLPERLALIVVDPRETTLSERANLALRPAPGADALLLRAWLAVLASGPNGIDPAALAAQAGVPVEAVRELAQRVAAARRPVIVYGKGLTAHQPEALALLQSVVRLTGHARLLGLRGEANSWTADRLQLNQLFTPAPDQPVFVDLGDDNASGRLLEAVKDAPFLVVAATYHSPLTERAAVVLPVEGWLEQSGHYVNLEGRLQAAEGVLSAPAEVRSNAAVLAGLGRALGLTLVDDWQARLELRPAAADYLNSGRPGRTTADDQA